MEIIKGANNPNPRAAISSVGLVPAFPPPSAVSEIIETAANINMIPIICLILSTSLKTNLHIMDVKTQYVANIAVITPQFIPLIYAYLNA